MRILFATPEAAPYYRTGGLADVARALPDALARRGHDVLVVHPFYRALRERGLPDEVADIARMPWPGGSQPVRYLMHRPETGAPALLVDQPGFFETDAPYDSPADDPFAAARRFAFFCRCVVERARAWGADVVHLNDWQTGLVPVYGRIDGLAAPTIFAIHNLAYQGNFHPDVLWQIGVPYSFHVTEGGLEFHGQSSFLKSGLYLSDALVTVSPTYSLEIRTEQGGAGLDGVLRVRESRLRGILNGIDLDTWNPATDAAIPHRYDAARLDAKELNRTELLHEVGLEDGPLLVMVTRLAQQKGIDLVLQALPRLVDMGVRLAVLGDGDAAYENALAAAVAAHPGRVAAYFRFDDALARRLYAGGDFFLMPSLYEPCGLGQMIAQRYGTPPIVRSTGGLADTVVEPETGFAFLPPTGEDLAGAVARALLVWRGREWPALQRRCMALDRSWGRSAAEYERLYVDAIGGLAG